MAFKKTSASGAVPESPDKLFRELTRRKIPDVLPHQAEMMQAYAQQAVDQKDVALQLPTGSGKTLVGLLIAEWRRRKFNERVVYLCPTRQLVHQVANQAEEKYGMSVGAFVGKQREYTPAEKTDYQQAEKVAITTYSGLFNTNSFFNDADVILLDDAHAAENYIASYWSLRIEREGPAAALHIALCNLLEPHLTTAAITRVRGTWDDAIDRSWVDMLPTPTLSTIKDELIQILDAHTEGNDLRYTWSVLRGHLDACHVYLSSHDILIRPLIPPTFSHSPFDQADQRIYMSATLGVGGDLERLTGRQAIKRLPAPTGLDTQGVGRRFFIFPEMSLAEAEIASLRSQLMQRAGRSVALVPSIPQANYLSDQITGTLRFPVFRIEDIEVSKNAFVAQKNAVAIIANRYDGVDFPGDDCRLLFLDGLPKAMNSQEKFLMSRMGANILYNERIQTRVVQAIGRCTRSLEDYSAVVVTGDELPDYLSDIRRRQYFHPELQAEIKFGVDQSRGTDMQNILDNFDIFLRNDREWEDANGTIVEARRNAQRTTLPAISDLENAAGWEVQYQTALWRADYESAVGLAEKILGALNDPGLRGYRALWHYLAGSAAHLGFRSGTQNLDAKSRNHFSAAYKCASDISWLKDFARATIPDEIKIDTNTEEIQEQVEKIAAELEKFGSSHERLFAKQEQQILEGLQNPKTFEQAQVSLGKLLGFTAGKVESDGSPDPWWICGKRCIVFEDYVNTDQDGALDITKARQASSHPNWMRANIDASKSCSFIVTVVSPSQKIKSAALVHAQELHYWEMKEFIAFAHRALKTIRELRTTFLEQGDLVWQAQASTALKDQQLDFVSIADYLHQRVVEKAMIPV